MIKRFFSGLLVASLLFVGASVASACDDNLNVRVLSLNSHCGQQFVFDNFAVQRFVVVPHFNVVQKLVVPQSFVVDNFRVQRIRVQRNVQRVQKAVVRESLVDRLRNDLGNLFSQRSTQRIVIRQSIRGSH